MAAISTKEPGVEKSMEGICNGQQSSHSVEALAEWRSSDQVENGMPSTSPPYWDSDDDDGGPKPSELYGKYTWKIDKFSQIQKRELRSNAFEVGGYKWYILIYPQGCDVCNHLSLFLCVANHDKLLPGWSHFAQFTIAVVNKDPKKSKYSDTLHRFWKKEHDWGWKKFMEQSKIVDGFIDETDAMTIKAQVQVIRERADRPFRCLDCQYRRELVRVYLTNVEQICRRFVEERRVKLGKLIEDKASWSSFCAFWLGMDQNTRRRMSKEKTDSILKIVVKNFFIEKEVTSTLVMDSLCSGLKALEGQNKGKTGKGKYLDMENLPVPIVNIEKDTFVLVDDVLLLLERAAMEPLPPKDEKGPQNRTKDVGSGEDFNKDSIERDEKRLTELGRRTIEIFVLAHIFNKIEIAYQEAVALKRQEELIREEEAACLAESEQKGKRGPSEKEKKSKKKQAKQKRSSRKAKDKGKDEKSCLTMQGQNEQKRSTGEIKDLPTEEPELVSEKPDVLEDISDASDSIDCVPEFQPDDSEDRDASPVYWDTDTSEIHLPTEASSSESSGNAPMQNGNAVGSPSLVDDNSSTCSTDSIPSVITNGPYKGHPPSNKFRKSPSRGLNQQGKGSETTILANESIGQPLEGFPSAIHLKSTSGSLNTTESGYPDTNISLQEQTKSLMQLKLKEEEVSPLRNLNAKEATNVERYSPSKVTLASPSKGPPREMPSTVQLQSAVKITPITDSNSVKKPAPENRKPTDIVTVSVSSAEDASTVRLGSHKTEAVKLAERPSVNQGNFTTEKPSPSQGMVTNEKPSVQSMPVMSRPLSAPLVPGPRPAVPAVSLVRTTPLLSRSASAAGRLGPEPSQAMLSYIPQSYRNAMMGQVSQLHSSNVSVSSANSFAPPSSQISGPLYLPQSSERMEISSMKPNFSFGMVSPDALHNAPQWRQSPQRDASRNISIGNSSQLSDIHNFYKPIVTSRSQDHLPSEFPAGTSGRQTQSAVADEFPHLDIINDLLDDEHGIGLDTQEYGGFPSFSNGPLQLNRQFTFPGDIGLLNDQIPSTSSCRFERAQSFHDGFQHNYPIGGSYDAVGDVISQADLRAHGSGQIDAVFPNHWQMLGNDPPYMSTDIDGYLYPNPDYSNMACGINGYPVFQPSNGL